MTTQSHLTASHISGYLDGDLTPGERAEVERHLDQCGACRLELAEVDLLTRPPAGEMTSMLVPKTTSAVWPVQIAIARIFQR